MSPWSGAVCCSSSARMTLHSGGEKCEQENMPPAQQPERGARWRGGHPLVACNVLQRQRQRLVECEAFSTVLLQQPPHLWHCCMKVCCGCKGREARCRRCRRCDWHSRGTDRACAGGCRAASPSTACRLQRPEGRRRRAGGRATGGRGRGKSDELEVRREGAPCFFPTRLLARFFDPACHPTPTPLPPCTCGASWA